MLTNENDAYYSNAIDALFLFQQLQPGIRIQPEKKQVQESEKVQNQNSKPKS